jgi:MFS family permease
MVFNTACGFSTTQAQMMTFRLLGGIGGSASLALGPAVVADLFSAEERGLAISIYSFIPILGPAIGPICGGFIAQYSTWHWGFWATSIASVPVLVAGVLFLEETYAPVLVEQEKRALSKLSTDLTQRDQINKASTSPLKNIRDAMVRPPRLLCTQPIIIVMGVYQAYLYGLMYLVLTTFPGMWQERYQQSVSVGGLNYISLGLGYCCGIQVRHLVSRKSYRTLMHPYSSLVVCKTISTEPSQNVTMILANPNSAFHFSYPCRSLYYRQAFYFMVGAQRRRLIGLCPT